ncbi:MAG TPA: TetR/AcrR family transcriptional regulator [Spirochaetota bacterium]|nr:TetR/AcrR family transcriptional regulator [Spirochaetota bacterium]HRZ27197.1 TetR/AcrR family transcriptional regulator [Spirochaetota bacterium]HSA14737.1 TetR/AcrR family transcriptional regulator [Spirochaetota bacterium]
MAVQQRKKSKEQREFIISKTRGLFWEKGYAETSMRDIARECGFKPANIYNFFSNKESILFEILNEEMKQIIAAMEPYRDDDGIDPRLALRGVIDGHVRLTLGERRSSKLLFDSGLHNLSAANRKKIIRLRDEYDSILSRIIRRGIDRGMFSISDEKIAVYSIASMIARTRIWYSPGGKYGVDEIVDFIYSFTLKGLGGRK